MRRPGIEAIDEPAGAMLERLVFFSDAVFAIAITLLALEIRLPEGLADAEVGDALIELTPMVFSYGLSFAVIGLYWLAHWRRFGLVRRADERLAILNLGHLAFIALIPFPTAMLGQHGDQPGPVAVYALVVAGAGLLGTLGWRYADGAGLVRPGVTRAVIRLETMRVLGPCVLFLASLPLIAIDPLLAEMAWVLVFPVQAVAIRRHLVAQAAEDSEVAREAG